MPCAAARSALETSHHPPRHSNSLARANGPGLASAGSAGQDNGADHARAAGSGGAIEFREPLRVFERVSKAHAKEMIAGRTFGAAKLRLLPKPGARKARPIVNMGRRWPVVATNCDGQRVTTYSVNAALAKPFAVLTGAKRAMPEVMGASVSSLGVELLVRYLPLVRLWRSLQAQQQQQQKREQSAADGGRGCAAEGPRRRRRRGSGGCEMIYMASLDVVRSFDSIKHDKLMTVVDSLLRDDEYYLRRCSTLNLRPSTLDPQTLNPEP